MCGGLWEAGGDGGGGEGGVNRTSLGDIERGEVWMGWFGEKCSKRWKDNL